MSDISKSEDFLVSAVSSVVRLLILFEKMESVRGLRLRRRRGTICEGHAARFHRTIVCYMCGGAIITIIITFFERERKRESV